MILTTLLSNRSHEQGKLLLLPSRCFGELRCLWGGLLEVRTDVGFDVPHRPGKAAQEELLEHRVFPDILAVPHRGVEDPTLVVLTGPGGGEARPLVHETFHSF